MRVLFAVVAIPIVAAAVFFGDWALAGLLAIAAAIGCWEYFGIARAAGQLPIRAVGIALAAAIPLSLHARALGVAGPTLTTGALALVIICAAAIWLRAPSERPTSAVASTLFGALYTGGLLAFGYALRYHDYVLGQVDRRAGGALLLLPLLLTWTSDTGAYAVGRAIGRRKLAPGVSPGKTIEGALGGLALCIVVAILYAHYVLVPWAHLAMLPGSAAIFGAVVSIATQLGDLFESLIKRDSGVKDSSHLIPGHGGVLDRIDGLLFALPVAYWLLGVLRIYPVPL